MRGSAGVVSPEIRTLSWYLLDQSLTSTWKHREGNLNSITLLDRTPKPTKSLVAIAYDDFKGSLGIDLHLFHKIQQSVGRKGQHRSVWTRLQACNNAPKCLNRFIVFPKRQQECRKYNVALYVIIMSCLPRYSSCSFYRFF